jgi:hypothetical protein
VLHSRMVNYCKKTFAVAVKSVWRGAVKVVNVETAIDVGTLACLD